MNVENSSPIRRGLISEREIARKRYRLDKKMGGYSEELRGEISGISSEFLEIDRYKAVRQDPERIRALAEHLWEEGLPQKDTRIIMSYFNLPWNERSA